MVEADGFWDKWAGDLLVGTLKEQQIRRLRIADAKVVYDEPIEIGERIRDMEKAGTGALIILTDSGKVIHLPPVTEELDVKVALAMPDEFRGCSECHSVIEGQPSQGAPNLHGIIGRDIASTEFDAYSDDMLAMEGAWTAENLNQYLADPAAFTPGSVMAVAGAVPNDQARAAVIEYLMRLP